MNRELEGRVAALAAGQHGVVTRGQLIAAGLSASAVNRRLKWGQIRQLHLGVFLVGPIVAPRAREMAAVLATGPGALVSHLSAASLWGLRQGPASTGGGRPERVEVEPVDITVVGGNRRCRPGIRVHRVVRLDAQERTEREGIPITAPGRTLIDLAGVVGRTELEGAVARAERERLVAREALSALLARHRGRAGMAALRAILRAPGGPCLTRSAAEAAFLALVRAAGLPAPEANVSIGRYEIDFLWRAEGIAVEVDGFRHHGARPRFEGDRSKDAWLLARGVKVMRLSWRQVTHDAVATAVQVGQALTRAGHDHVLAGQAASRLPS
jgi:very-short-patch-repair endonuclease